MKTNFAEILIAEVLRESLYIARAYNSTTIEVEHCLLSVLKKSPNNLVVKYLETIMSREEWKKLWQSKLKDNAEKTAPQKDALLSLSSPYLHRVFKAVPLEKELLKIDEIDETCVFLAILRYRDVDKLTYRSAIEFFKKHR